MNLIQVATRVEDPNGEGRAGFEVTTEDLYPAAVGDLLEAVEYERVPRDDSPLKNYYLAASQLPEEAWKLALAPKDGMDDGQRRLRATVLELSRLWFTELLHESVGHVPMYFRIRKADGFDWSL